MSGTVSCNGPLGPQYVVNIVSNTTPATGGLSLCNGTTMSQIWWVNSYIIGTPTWTPQATSWIYYSAVTPTTSTTATITAGSYSIAAPFFYPGVAFTPPVKRKIILPSVIRAGRRALRRSINLYAGFRGMEEARRFIAGEPITLEGQLFDYQLSKRDRLLEQAMNPDSHHVPYHLNLIEKATRARLASGCVVFRGLPVFDQMLAVAFHVQDRADEIKLLKTTNWTPGLSRIARQRMAEAA